MNIADSLNVNIPAENFKPTTQEIKNRFQILTKETLSDGIEYWKNQIMSYKNRFNNQVDKLKTAYPVLKKMFDSMDQPNEVNMNMTVTKDILKNTKKEMAEILYNGQELILQIRQAFTGQMIHTVIYVKGPDGEIYRVPAEKLENLSIELSTFGASGNNPFSAAYTLTKKEFENFVNENQDTIDNMSDTLIYKKILSIKQKIYTRWWFDSKDMEIIELYKNNKTEIKLGEKTYRHLRSVLGGGGGYHSSLDKIGDIGDIQVKYMNLQKYAKSYVNTTRFTLIKNHLEKIYEALNSDQVLQHLLKMFTEEESRIETKLSKISNKEAKKYMRDLFKGFPPKN